MYISLQVYLGEQYVNSSTLSDVTFLVEGWYYFMTLISSVGTLISFSIVSQIILILSTGKRFYAHRIALLASSDAFRAMFDGGYRVSFDA